MMLSLLSYLVCFFSVDALAAESTSLRQTVEQLSSFESRLAGYPGSAAAADYIERHLLGLGLETHRDTFAVVVPVDLGGRLAWGDESVVLRALWPNAARTATLPPEGVRALAVWGGHGDWGDFNGEEIAGRVVVLDFASGDNWLKAAALGARAVIFIAPESATTGEAQSKYVQAPLDVPRFWLQRSAGQKLRRRLAEGAVEVELWGRTDWAKRPAWNIWAKIPGTDPELGAEQLVLHAYYDAPSVVPALAPGAEAAASIAALLKVAHHLRVHPPARPVILAALGAHFQARQGMVDFLSRHARRLPYYARRLAAPLAIDLFIGLDLSSHGERVVLWNNTGSYQLKRYFVPFGRRFAAYAEQLGRAEDLANGISPIRGMDWNSFMPGGLSVDGALPLDAGYPSLTLATVNDARFALDLPLDRSEQVDWAKLERQTALIAGLLSGALNDPALLAEVGELNGALKDRTRDLRVKARTFPRRSQVPDRPVAGALVGLEVDNTQTKGVRDMRYFLADERGEAEIRGLSVATYLLGVYAIDSEDGTITHTVDLSERVMQHHGGLRASSGLLGTDVRWQTNEQVAVLFPTIGRPFYGLVDPRFLSSLRGLKVYSGAGTEPRQYGYALARSGIGTVGVLYASAAGDEESRLKVVVGSPSRGKRLLLLNSTGNADEEQARGRGFLLAEESLATTTLQAAKDMWNLDEARMRTLAGHGIENQRLTRLHDRAGELIGRAEAAAERLQWDRYMAWSREALGVEARAYPEVLETLNDVIKGMVFFLALLLPAAFFGERLLFAAADIRRQLAGFGLLLAVIWFMLSQVHPAFELAHPLVILLAFAIMAMASLVLFMLVGRFNHVMDQHKSRQARVHVQDLSRLSASYAAFMLGISNMRRRPLRTSLTLATLTLLTFTLLSFTSFDQQIRYASFALPQAGTYAGVLMRDRGWQQLDAEALDYAESHFADRGVVGRRGWYVAEGEGERNWVEIQTAGHAARATGLLGLTPAEAEITQVAECLVAGSFFVADDEASCILPLDMAERLGIALADVGKARVQVFGRDLIVRGIADAERLAQLRDLDGESLMPANFELSGADLLNLGSVAQGDITDEEEFSELRPFIHVAPQNVLILPYETLALAGGSLRSVALRFAATTDGRQLVEDYLLRVAATLFVGLPDGEGRIAVRAFSSVGLTSVQGLGALMIPALVAALIVLNAMMGAVYERLREIGIYSSVGLAPVHIALLFIAEACVFAVIGTTLGYLLGQGLGRVLLALGLLEGITLNYSSLAAIGAALTVMAVVLLSTIYPARAAARRAVPDVMRRWQPDPPTGDDWLFEFPFMLNASEVEGVCGFLGNYFAAFSRATLGDFYSEEIRVDSDGNGLDFVLWLAPFDLGVSQEVRVDFVATGAKSRAIEVRLKRISGEQLYWRRLNRRFVEALRKQLLIWHTLKEHERGEHVQSARALAAAPVEEEKAVAAAVQTGDSTFTWKGFAVGGVLSFCIGLGAPYAVIMLRGSYMAINSSSPGALFLFFILVFVVNTLLRTLSHRYALAKADLVLVYAMLLLASAVPTQAFVGYLIPVISGLYYYATPENRWSEIFFPHVTGWLAPQDRQAVIDLHEGLPPGERIPWGAWSETLIYWYVFFLALSFMMLCMSAILHRQWSQNERLAYPLVQLPLKMVAEGGAGFKLGPFFKQRLLWIGFAVPFILLSMKGLHHYMPEVPLMTRSAGQLLWFGKGGALGMNWVYAWIGFFYLVNLDISFSIWCFHILSKAQEGLCAHLGIASSEKLSLYSFSQTADLTHQVMGACLVFVGYTLWMGRRHLVDVWRKAISGDPDIDDSGELLSYRVAVFGFLASLAFVAIWLWASGIPLVILPLFLATCLIFYVFVTRVIATAGLATARSPMVAAFFVISAIGAPVIGAKGLTALTFTYVWQSEMRLFPLIAASNALKLAEVVPGSKRRLFWGMALALLLSLIGATWIILTVCYEYGGINLHPFFMTHQAERTFTDMARPLVDPLPANERGWIFTGVGAVVETLLMWGHHRFYWWPLHPVGFVVGVGWLTGQIWFSVFLAWFFKLLIVKWGGMPLYEKAKPLFLGLILGEAVTAGLWLCIDGILGETGNMLSFM